MSSNFWRGGGVNDLTFIAMHQLGRESLLKLLLQIRVNALGFPFGGDATLGWSLHARASRLNHSCSPNCAVVLAACTNGASTGPRVGRALEVVTLREVCVVPAQFGCSTIGMNGILIGFVNCGPLW